MTDLQIVWCIAGAAVVTAIICVLVSNSREARQARRAPNRPPARGGFICWNCGYHGRAKRKSKGSFLMFLFLLCLMVLPALIYLVLYNGCVFACPRCGIKVADVA
jgi:hypothetical protein